MPLSNEHLLRRILNENPLAPLSEDELEEEMQRRAEEIRRSIGRLIPEAARILNEHKKSKN